MISAPDLLVDMSRCSTHPEAGALLYTGGSMQHSCIRASTFIRVLLVTSLMLRACTESQRVRALTSKITEPKQREGGNCKPNTEQHFRALCGPLCERTVRPSGNFKRRQLHGPGRSYYTHTCQSHDAEPCNCEPKRACDAYFLASLGLKARLNSP